MTDKNTKGYDIKSLLKECLKTEDFAPQKSPEKKSSENPCDDQNPENTFIKHEILETYFDEKINESYQNTYDQNSQNPYELSISDQTSITSNQSNLSLLATCFGDGSVINSEFSGAGSIFHPDAPPTTPIKINKDMSELKQMVQVETKIKIDTPLISGSKYYKNASLQIKSEKRSYKNRVNNFILCEEMGCGKTFKTLQEHEHHFLRHHFKGDKPVACLECGMKFNTKYELERHCKYKHQKIKEYQCSKCKKSFVEKSKLLRHFNTHKDDENKTFICKWCEIGRYTTNSALKLHIKNKHPEMLHLVGRKKNEGWKNRKVPKVPKVEKKRKAVDKDDKAFKVPKKVDKKLKNKNPKVPKISETIVTAKTEVPKTSRTVEIPRVPKPAEITDKTPAKRKLDFKEFQPSKLTRRALKELNTNLTDLA